MSITASNLLATLEEIAPGRVKRDVDLSSLSQWRIGGLARAVVEPTSREQAARLIGYMHERPEPWAIVGQTSNILFSSDGFDGVLIRVGANLARWEFDDNILRADAGALVPELVSAAAARGLGGIVHAAGIPGTIGGLVIMNGGTRRLGVGSHVRAVTAADTSGQIRTLTRDELRFSYRSSVLQEEGLIVLGVELELERGDRGALLSEIAAIRAERASKFPLDLPNCGSTFLSDPAMYEVVGPPGLAIERVGLKGKHLGGAQISPVHANFIVNNGGATDGDVLGLISLIRTTVAHETGFMMDCEVRYLSPTGELRPAHLEAERRRSTHEGAHE
jgi:UDP-N-acetylmuramate dehydrogenase